MYLKGLNVKERMEYYRVPGMSITFIDGGEISATENYGLLEAGLSCYVNEKSIFNASSISKFLTGFLAMKLMEDGLLDLDAGINKKLKSFKIPDNGFNKNITLRNLLSHQSGIKDPEGSFSELKSTAGAPSMIELLEGKSLYCNEAIEV